MARRDGLRLVQAIGTNRPASASSGGTDVSAGRPGGSVGWGGYRPNSCTFTATQAGGYEGDWLWQLRISRHGQQIDISNATSPGCGTNVVRPGDDVTVEAGAGRDNAATADHGGSFIKVGPQYHC